MGADLYSTGYFRDNYTPSSVLWQYGLSWGEDVAALLDEEDTLSVAKAKTLLTMVRKRTPLFEENLAQYTDEGQQYFRDRSIELQAFLEEAIRGDCPIRCSL